MVRNVIRSIFDHIPKTGGTSVRACLAASLGQHDRSNESTFPHHVIVRYAGARRFLSAHFWFYPGEAHASDWYYTTLLRDPVDRFLSQYYFQRQHRQLVQEGLVSDCVTRSAVEMDLDSYLAHESADLRRSYWNVQACHFAARLCDRPHELSAPQLLDAAITSLEDYDLVGVYSEINTFIDFYFEALGLPAQHLPVLNVTPGRKSPHELDRDIRDRLHAANLVDMKLLDWAGKRFARRRFEPPVSGTRRSKRAPVADRVAFGTREIEILAVELGGTNRTGTPLTATDAIGFQLTCRSWISDDDFTVGVAIRDANGDTVGGISSKVLGIRLAIQARRNFLIHIAITTPLPPGDYSVTVALHKGVDHLDRCYHWIDDAARLRIGPEQARNPYVEQAGIIASEALPVVLEPMECDRAAGI